jgi:hypothetical protein
MPTVRTGMTSCIRPGTPGPQQRPPAADHRGRALVPTALPVGPARSTQIIQSRVVITGPVRAPDYRAQRRLGVRRGRGPGRQAFVILARGGSHEQATG